MRGPAYDKSGVGAANNGVGAITQGDEEKPKWEGTKIVKSGTKKYGQFGSGGRRDQLRVWKETSLFLLIAHFEDNLKWRITLWGPYAR